MQIKLNDKSCKKHIRNWCKELGEKYRNHCGNFTYNKFVSLWFVRSYAEPSYVNRTEQNLEITFVEDEFQDNSHINWWYKNFHGAKTHRHIRLVFEQDSAKSDYCFKGIYMLDFFETWKRDKQSFWNLVSTKAPGSLKNTWKAQIKNLDLVIEAIDESLLNVKTNREKQDFELELKHVKVLKARFATFVSDTSIDPFLKEVIEK